MKCEIIRDLIPSYIDGLTSEESNQEIRTHLECCEKCSKYIEEMGQSLATPKVEMEDKVYMQVLKKVKKIEIERVALIASIAVIIAVLVFSSIHKHFYGIHNIGIEELNIRCESYGNNRKLVFEARDERWLVSVGYTEYGNEDEGVLRQDGKKPIYIISPLKSRKFELPNSMLNCHTVEFVDEDTYIDYHNNIETQAVDFDETDYITIDFGTEKRAIRLCDLYNGNIDDLK